MRSDNRQIGASARTCSAAAISTGTRRHPSAADVRSGSAEDHRLCPSVPERRCGDFDAIRAMLADDVKLELVNRLQWEGRDKIAPYFTRYAEETTWRFALGAVEGRPAMLVFDSTGPMVMPAHFVLIDWSASEIV